MSRFVSGQIVAHWKTNHAVYAIIRDPADYIRHIYPSKDRIDWFVETPARSGITLIVKEHALAELTDQEQQDYVLALLEDRDTMKIPRI